MTLTSNAIIGFFMIRFFLGQLGEVQYGIWVLICSIFGYRSFLNMGLNSSINRYIPVYLATNNNEGIQRVISTSLFFFSILAFLLVLISFIIYHNIGSWFAIRPDLVDTAGTLVLIVGCCFSISMPLQISSAVLSGFQRYDMENLATLITLLIRTVLLIVLMLRGHGLIMMGLIFGLSEIVVRVLQLAFVKQLIEYNLFSFKNIDLKLLRKMLIYGINTFLYAMGALILLKASDLVIGIYLGTAEISQFAIAMAGIMLLSQLLEAFTAAIKPAISDLDTRKDQVRIREISFLTQKYSLLLLIPAGCFLVVMGKDFIWIWVGDKFQDPARISTMGSVLAILTVGHCIRLAHYSNFLVLVGRGDHRVFGIFTALTALFCVSASVVSVKVFNWGLIGIAWSNFLPMALVSGIILPIYFNWRMHISASENVRRVWWPSVLGTLPTIIMICIWKYFYPPENWRNILMVILTAIMLTALSSWLFCISKLEQKRLVRFFA